MVGRNCRLYYSERLGLRLLLAKPGESIAHMSLTPRQVSYVRKERSTGHVAIAPKKAADEKFVAQSK